MHHPVEANTIVKNAGATSNHDAIMAWRLPGKAYARAKVAQRYPVLRSEHTVKLADAWRKRTMSTLLYRPCIVVFGPALAAKGAGAVNEDADGGIGTLLRSLAHWLVRLPYLSASIPKRSHRTPRLRVNLLFTFQSS